MLLIPILFDVLIPKIVLIYGLSTSKPEAPAPVFYFPPPKALVPNIFP